ncbi:N-6 adenine specific DNA methyltransferase [Candidatus Phytoplasma mali]|uniref:site-specific DNA-methyltransferase (adenine-specific) n=1 Tax=Phytoplasma mali (strain AT) TaxID=482235 RepID=B3R049_PHYMT|nr:N-6 DNA methylase [Candidatus Phytoplasma mali]CAP18213.1 N-6 adenine specific DNA methyltransferase [Candidatus Phytoplasma mali]CAP18659.1 N-6 adenine specific DNA methyltransferase [Candidatus Phytoplasma mali]
MVNERKTEQLVRKMLKEAGYYNNPNIIIEEQSSDNPRINKLLKTASKSGDGKGYPDFIISFVNQQDKLILIECKASTTKHESLDKKQYKDYAFDGVLLYANYCKKDFDVTAIVISGETEQEKKISTFLWIKESYYYKNIQNKLILNPQQLNEIITEQKKPISEEALIMKAVEYNKLLHSNSIPEVERCIIISSILVALQNKVFINEYKLYTHKENDRLIDDIVKFCKQILEDKQISKDKIQTIVTEYSKYKNNKQLTSPFIKDKKTKTNIPNNLLRNLIDDVNDNILPYIRDNKFDILGKFYTQFIKYAGGDKKTGLVLTPIHITEFFCDLINIQPNDIVFDPCCGTGGFLVSAMKAMVQNVKYEKNKQAEIKLNQLIGIEIRPDMFSHVCSNMMMRGDGKSNIFHGNCFDDELIKIVKKKKPNISFLNPPYSNGNAEEQLEFIENSLNCLTKGGECVAICQMSTALNTKGLTIKERLFQKHTLKAVLSMPEDLFYPVGVATVILIWEAHIPHDSNINTFFGYFKNDGFVKTKYKGRIDINNKWPSIKNEWLITYKNKQDKEGLSVNHPVKYHDEWLAEEYLTTNYDDLTDDIFIKKIKELIAFEFLNVHNNTLCSLTNEKQLLHRLNLNINKMKFFSIQELFMIERGKDIIKDLEQGDIPLVSSSSLNNGVKDNVQKGKKLFPANCITIANNGSIGSSFYQNKSFYATPDVTILRNKKLNVYNALFITILLEKEKYRFNYGRKWSNDKMKNSQIKVPTNDKGGADWEFMEEYIKSLPYSENFNK